MMRLRDFIVSRSARFAEPAILLEILDHFACKTEELLQEDAGLSLEQAMQKAHRSFGVQGFAPLAAAYEQSLSVRYGRLYRAAFGRVLGSVHLAGLLGLALLVQQLCRSIPAWSAGSFGGAAVILGCELVYALCFFTIRTKALAGRKQRLFFDQCLEASHQSFMILWLGLPLIVMREQLPAGLMAWLAALLAFMLGLQLLVVHRLLGVARADTDLVEKQLAATL